MTKLRKFSLILLLTLILIVLYSHLIGTKGLKIKEYSVINNKLTDNHHGLKIVHFSDLHYGTTVHLKELKNIIEEINLLQPEIIFFTGDLIDKKEKLSKDELLEVINLLNSIKPVISSYIVRGNHDHQNQYEEFLKNTNFTLLSNESDFIYYNDDIPILVIGLEDSLEGTQDIPEAFSNYNEEYFTILLTHEPDSVINIKEYKPDLILAGHSHNGQVRIPLVGSIIKVEGAKQYYDEKYLINDKPMYISGGLGTSTLPFRLFNPPSFNFYRLYNK